MKARKPRSRTLSTILLLAAAALSPSACREAESDPLSIRITVDASGAAGEVSPLVFGYNLLWPRSGMGIWRPDSGDFDPAILDPVEKLGARSLRYPGGTVSHTYRWDFGIGPRQERRPVKIAFLDDPKFAAEGRDREIPEFGTDEFLALCRRTGAEPLVVVAFEEGTPQEAAAWVAYLNGTPDDPTPIGSDSLGRDWKDAAHWARLRAAHGHPEPYGVRYFEIGNELDLHRYRRTIEEYCDEFSEYRSWMRKVDPSILVGAVGRSVPNTMGEKDEEVGTGRTWNETLFRRVGKEVDFLCLHYYPRQDHVHPEYLEVLGEPYHFGKLIRRIRDIAREMVPDHEIRIAVTEHAADLREPGTESRRPNASLKAALANADTIFELIRSGVFLACLHFLNFEATPGYNHFAFFSSVFKLNTDRVILFPGYDLVRLLSASTGKRWYPVGLECPGFRPDFNTADEVPYLSVLATGDADEGNLVVMVINKHPTDTLEAALVFEDFLPRVGEGVVFTGPDALATNDEEKLVGTRPFPLDGVGQEMHVAFPPLSLVVLRLEGS